MSLIVMTIPEMKRLSERLDKLEKKLKKIQDEIIRIRFVNFGVKTWEEEQTNQN